MGPSDIARAIWGAEMTEIYLLRRDVSTRTNMRAYHLRTLGCLYRVQGATLGAEFERALAGAAVRLAPGRAEDEGNDLRVGIVIGDRRGTILEVYADDRPGSDGMVSGFSQRRSVRLSMSFVPALRRFAAEHRGLMVVDPSRRHLCERPRLPDPNGGRSP